MCPFHWHGPVPSLVHTPLFIGIEPEVVVEDDILHSRFLRHVLRPYALTDVSLSHSGGRNYSLVTEGRPCYYKYIMKWVLNFLLICVKLNLNLNKYDADR